MAKTNRFKSSITVAIPAYNEAENVAWLVKQAISDLNKLFVDYEIVAIDDGSSDQTGVILDRLTKKYKRLRVVHQTNGGYSAAMLAGIRAARKKFVAYMPADGQILIPDMLRAFKVMDEYDLVLGYRGRRSDYSIYRLILSYGYLLLLWMLFGISYRDVGWATIWRSNKVQQLHLSSSRGIFLLTEIVAKFKRRGWKITEVSSVYQPRKAGSVKNAKLSVVMDTWLRAWSLWWSFITGKDT